MEFKRKITENPPELPDLSMYTVDGHKPPSDKHYALSEKSLPDHLVAFFDFLKKYAEIKNQSDLVNLIREAFKSPDTQVQLKAVEMIEYVPDDKKEGLIKEALKSPDIQVQLKAVEMIEYVPDDKKRELINIYTETGNPEHLTSNPLYGSLTPTEQKKFGRHPFKKSGSETTLITGELYNKVIIRHITAEAFFCWKRAFEAKDTWEENDFDYVPIEPIVSFKEDKKSSGLMRVYGGVLDINYQTWKNITNGKFDDILSPKIKKIQAALKKLHINHGHDGIHNFVLRFFRDSSGKPDLNKCPRIYCIDFDAAKIFT